METRSLISDAWAIALVVAAVCLLLWALLVTASASGPPGSRLRAAAIAAILVAPIFVVGELWYFAVTLRRTEPSMPWVVAAVGALGLAVLVPLVATQTPRLPADTRRRATANIALIVVMCTLMGEMFVYIDAPWARPLITLMSFAVMIWSLLQRRKSRAG